MLDSLASTSIASATTATSGDRATVRDCGECTTVPWQPTDRVSRRRDGTALRSAAQGGCAGRFDVEDAMAQQRWRAAAMRDRPAEGTRERRGPAEAVDALPDCAAGTAGTKAGNQTKTPCREIFGGGVAFRKPYPCFCLYNGGDNPRTSRGASLASASGVTRRRASG